MMVVVMLAMKVMVVMVLVVMVMTIVMAVVAGRITYSQHQHVLPKESPGIGKDRLPGSGLF